MKTELGKSSLLRMRTTEENLALLQESYLNVKLTDLMDLIRGDA